MRRLLASTTVVAAVLTVLAACGEEPVDPGALPSPTGTVGPEPTEDPIEGDGRPETNVSWTVPYRAPGWDTTIQDQDGIHQFVHAESQCQVMLRQSLVGPDEGDGLGPRDSLDVYRNQVRRTVQQIELVDAERLEFTSTVTTAGTVPFVTSAFAYLGNDGVEYVNVIAAEWFGDVELMVATACPTDVWESDGPDIVRAFLDEVSIGAGSL